MSIKWTKKHVDDLLKAGKIRGYVMHEPKKQDTPAARLVSKHFDKPASPEKDWMGRELLAFCQQMGIVLKEELIFDRDKKRKFRFDWAIEGRGLKIAIEYEGIVSKRSRHTSLTGYTKDCEKYNMAMAQGWLPLRFTALNYKDLITELNKHI